MKGENYLIPFEPLTVPKYVIYYVTHTERIFSFLYLMSLVFFLGEEERREAEKPHIISPCFNNKIITSHGGAYFSFCKPRHVESPLANQN